MPVYFAFKMLEGVNRRLRVVPIVKQLTNFGLQIWMNISVIEWMQGRRGRRRYWNGWRWPW